MGWIRVCKNWVEAEGLQKLQVTSGDVGLICDCKVSQLREGRAEARWKREEEEEEEEGRILTYSTRSHF